jgi:ParB/RepB/Spo0J family partition protein
MMRSGLSVLLPMRGQGVDLELHQLDLKYEGLRIVDPGRQARLMSSLAEHGQQSPVLVVDGEERRYLLIDGYQRVSALRNLGSDTVGALVLSMSLVEALLFSHRQRSEQSRPALEEGWLVGELMEVHGLSMDEVAVKLCRSKSWVSRRLGLVKVLPERIQDLVRKGDVCVYAATKYLVPLARANKRHCIQLAEGIGGKKLSVRQVGLLYVGWRRADSGGRERIVEKPMLYLKAEEELRLPEPKAPGEDLHQELLGGIEGLGGLSRKIKKLLRKDTALGIGGFLETLGSVWKESRAAFESMAHMLEERLNAGHGHADGDSEVEGSGARDQGHSKSSEGYAQDGQAGA